MTQLEQTIIANAKRELAVVLVYYGQKAAGIKAAKGEDAWLEYLGHYNSLTRYCRLPTRLNQGSVKRARKHCSISKRSTLKPIE
ncbi:hypothetical protein [Stutzerimonas stutzeri]|uniref:hypothetical protein n=1 Tax=Stutzerimonas stutzeri TaxID=316 RepID=UPI0003153733|nr:hypothetical protein [Stutzerimonas stutzeri]